MANTYTIPITIPAGKVNSDLSGFPVMLLLEHLPSTFWNNVKTDGGDIRIYNNESNQIPHDLVYIDVPNAKGLLFFKADLLTASSNVFSLEYGDGNLERLPYNDTYGRNAVWSAYEMVTLLEGYDGGEDRTGKNGFPTRYGNAKMFNLTAVSGNVESHQGVTFDGTFYYTTDTNAIRKWSSSWVLIIENETPLAESGISGVDHIGDLEYYNGYLYTVIEKYPSGPYVNQHIARFDPTTLAFVDSVNISAQAHEVSGICHYPELGVFVVTDYTDGTKLHKYNHTTLAYEGYISLSTTIANLQGITYWNKKFYLSSNTGLYHCNLNGTGIVCLTDNYTGGSYGEGLTHNDSEILRVESSGEGQGVVYKALRISSKLGVGAYFDGSDDYYTIPAARLTTWAMGVYANISGVGQNRCFMSYGPIPNSDLLNRTSLAYRNTSNKFGLWNNDDAWLFSSVAYAALTWFRFNAKQNGTTERTLYTNGANSITDSGVVEKPGVGSNGFYIGIENENKNEDMYGYLTYLYLTNSYLTADWVAAEYSNANSPVNFYSIGDSGEAFEPFDLARYAAFFLNAGSHVVELETLEISHPNFTKTYYIVRNAIDGITVKLETAVYQEFEYYPLRITPIGSGDDLDQVLKVQLGDLGELLPNELKAIFAADGFGVKPTVKYRTYRSDDLDAPLYGPVALEVNNIAFNKQGAVFEATAPRLNTTATGELYTTNRFPMLRGFI